MTDAPKSPKPTLRQKIKSGLKAIVQAIGDGIGQAKFGGGE